MHHFFIRIFRAAGLFFLRTGRFKIVGVKFGIFVTFLISCVITCGTCLSFLFVIKKATGFRNTSGNTHCPRNRRGVLALLCVRCRLAVIHVEI